MANTSGRVPPPTAPLELAWPIASDATLEEALNIGADVFQHAATAVPSLPHRDPRRLLPATMSDALTIVHARDDAKKKTTAKQGSKSRHKAALGAAGAQTQFLGAVEGGGDSESAFWMYMEVRGIVIPRQ
jgi:hypothetical protein